MPMSVILRNVPPHCQEEELCRALCMYGNPVSASIVPHMRQATVTMRTPQEARALISHRCINLFGQSVTVEPGHYSAGNNGIMHMATPPLSAGTRLNVVVEKCTYPVTKEVLTQVFSIVGTPSNVYCGASNQTTTGWVEYPDAATAQRALRTLNNNSIYPECCYMTLSIDHNAAPAVMGSYVPPATSYLPPQPQPQPPMQPHQPMAMPFGHSNYGAMPGAMPTRGGMGRGRGRGRGAIAGRAGHMGPYSGHSAHHFQGSPYNAAQADAVVIVSNVPENISLHDLWLLLEVYGNVNTLKRQYSAKTTVVAHFQNVHDARLAVQHLQNCPYHGSTLSLKHFAGYTDRSGRTEWNSGPATDPTVQAFDFTFGHHHRTKPSAAFNPTGRVRPDKNLFISNLTESITDEDIKVAFSKCGFVVSEYYRKSPSVAIVGLDDIETAVHALIAMHSQQLKERFLRVTFSHFPPGPRANGESNGNDEKDGLDADEKNENIEENTNEEEAVADEG